MENAWQFEKIPIFQDNFVFVIHNTKDAIVVDPGEPLAVMEYLNKFQLKCQMILITHHHADHIDGVLELKNKFLCPVYAPLKNQLQLDQLATDWVKEGDVVMFQDLKFEVLELPGHTLGHIAYSLLQQKWIFSGDVLFALGCGRLFEGSFEKMFKSLQKIKALDNRTLIFCTHDYFSNNQRFCLKENISFQGYRPVHPLLLEQEKKFNPFLMAADVPSFQRVREKRNQF